MIDTKAFRNLSYGLYIISSKRDDKPVGCVVNTFAQVTSKPAQVSVAVNKENYTSQGIQETGAYEVAVMNESASMELIGKFGFHSSADTDKFSDFETAVSEQGIEYVTQSSCAHFSVKVTQELDLGSHILFIGEVIDATPIAGDAPMTYAYYHQVKGGKTPPKASSYNGGEDEVKQADQGAEETKPKVAWRCKICGHIEYAEELPEDFVCPVCGVGRELFECIEV